MKRSEYITAMKKEHGELVRWLCDLLIHWHEVATERKEQLAALKQENAK